MKRILWAGILLILALPFLTGCATTLGKVPSASGPVTFAEVDCLHGVITEKNAIGPDSVINFDPESYITVDKYGTVQEKQRFFEWEPLGGADITVGDCSPFVGIRYFSLLGFGLHWGGDVNNFIPFGVDYKKWGFVLGVGVAVPWTSFVNIGTSAPVKPNLMLSFPL